VSASAADTGVGHHGDAITPLVVQTRAVLSVLVMPSQDPSRAIATPVGGDPAEVAELRDFWRSWNDQTMCSAEEVSLAN
jgi:hypothetical protein